MNLKLKDFKSYALPVPGWYLPMGFLLELSLWAFFVIGVYYSFRHVGPIDKFTGRVMTMVLVVTLYFGLDMARRLKLNTRKRLLAADSKPILYLRPFSQERSDNSMRHVDSLIATALRDIGPLVAVGVPQEKLPPVGALRLYFKDEEWREQVKALMSISRLIIIQPGNTAGIEWEMKTAKQYFSPEQIYISALGEGVFKSQLERVFGMSLPGSRFYGSCFISFDSNWSPMAATISRRRNFFLSSRFAYFGSFEGGFQPPAVREMLRPVFQQRGMKLSMWRSILRVVIGYSIFGIAMYCLIFRT